MLVKMKPRPAEERVKKMDCHENQRFSRNDGKK